MAAPNVTDLASGWERRMRELVDRFDVPGAVLGVSHRGERVLAAAGVAGLRNPQPVSTDAIFQLGSISKVYSATLLLAIAGPEILERPVAELVPEAAWMDHAILVRHLLTHSSGLGGDYFADTGRGDDALARYVTELAQLPRDVPLAPGARYSYCNSGFAVLGRLIEVLSGQSYDAALRTRLLDPLGARATVTLAEDAIMHPVALGHNRHEPAPLRADDTWSFSRACNPLGGVCASAADLLSFAELHLRDGRTGDGTAILDPDTARLMRRRHLETPPLTRPSARGLGWGIFDWEGAELVGHDGETLGQIASLRLHPDEQLALVVLTNAIPDGDEITRALAEAVLEPWGLVQPTIAVPVGDGPFDPAPYLGRYRNLDAIFDVDAAEQGLTVRARTIAEGLEDNTEVTRLVPLGDGAFVDGKPERRTRAVRFDDPGPDGRCQSFFAGRIAWRVSAEHE
ncbi:MAG TPA: serine hydrolase domain-containing protein [Solirubrobacteraceae bacterium]|jgi:CubicO group peptidase (beta-lactamase class C family)